MTGRALIPLAFAIVLGVGLGIAAEAAGWSDFQRYLVGALIAAVLVGIGVPFGLARRRDDRPWADQRGRVAGLHAVQGVAFLGEAAREREWSHYWWVRMPMRWDNDQRPERRIKQTPVSVLSPKERETRVGIDEPAREIHPRQIPHVAPPAPDGADAQLEDADADTAEHPIGAFA